MSFWDWFYVGKALPLILAGLVITVEATVLGFSISLVLGLVVALIRRSSNRYVSTAMTEVVEFIRSTPLLVQLFFVYYVGPSVGIVIPAWTAGIAVLGIHHAAFCSEIYRAGIDTVEGGQWEACIALNLVRARTWRAIILPQAIAPIIPGLGNVLIGMFKDAPILAAISILEMLQQALIVGGQYYRYTEAITMVGFFYLVLTLIASTIVRTVSKGINRHYHLEWRSE